MDRLIYTAVSGANRSLVQQRIHANNLANANTQGFRADLERATATAVAGAGYASRYLVSSENGGINMAAGTLQETGRELDIAVQGAGLIAVSDGRRERYTRNGHIDIDDMGNLSISGKPLLGEDGPIQLPPFSQLAIGNDGTITVIPEDGNVAAAQDVARIKLVSLPDAQLRKNNDGWLVGPRATAAHSEQVQIVSEHLEASNVSTVNEMVQTLALSRQFEAQIKMMKAADTLAQSGNRLLRAS
ncbi:flagellar basal body rod protein FlgF [Pantoea sp. Mb-10]|uniref:flagellar basal body rod protein FlgF n=1 Tax=unclassified Pantoea TaxID=2630326 RepID=UPI001E52FC74|nr:MULTISPECIES: flagellar basal body rod protein FlgF [unclassified Pantoea]MCE0489867.1 flagellar basal body rod protein FlgF [Pantoea sp. Mb-10]MCE0501027.1 flagellar basal body rod protein FlgF [Pantoea sp. Pb-8]